MKKKLSVVKSQPKIPGLPAGTTLSQQPATHKILSQSKQKKFSSGSFMCGLRNKENEIHSPKPRSDTIDKKRFQSTLALVQPSNLDAREKVDECPKERDDNLLKPQPRKIHPSTEKYSTVASGYPSSMSSHRSPSHRKQFLFPQSTSNAQKPVNSTTRSKRFSSIRKSQAQVPTNGAERYAARNNEPSVGKYEKKEPVWGKRELVLSNDKKSLKDTNFGQPATTKEKNGNNLAKFCTQLPAPKTILQVSSYSNLFSAVSANQAANYYYISTLIQAFSDRTNNTTFMQLTRNHLNMTLQVLNITRTIERPNVSTHTSSQVPRPISGTKHTLVFDLDETLIHCNQSTDIPYDVLLNIVFPNGQSTKAGINVRPHAHQILKELAEFYDLIIFTASHECYANVVIDYLDPKGTLIKSRYFRDSCYRTPEGLYIKDLRVIGRPLEKMLLIDNAAYSYAFQLDNGVPVIPFYDDKTDLELKHLSSYLRDLSTSKDIRKDNTRYFKTRHYMNFSDPIDLIKTLYPNFLESGQ